MNSLKKFVLFFSFISALFFVQGGIFAEEPTFVSEAKPQEPKVSFGNVFGDHLAAADFAAGDERLLRAVVYFFTPNNATVGAEIRDGGVSGKLIAQAVIPRGQEGETVIPFQDKIYLQPGKIYTLVVRTGEPATGTGSLCAAVINEVGTIASYTERGYVAANLSFRIEFAPWIGDKPTTEFVDPPLESEYIERVEAWLREQYDVPGEEILELQGGATRENVTPLLKPLFLVGTALTESGVYYIPMGQPTNLLLGGGPRALHVADGSQIISQTGIGTKLSINVGNDGKERYGSARHRLEEPTLAEGYLPILQTVYTDAQGIRWQQESFTVTLSESGLPATFIQLTPEWSDRTYQAPIQARFTFSEGDIAIAGNHLLLGEKTLAIVGRTGTILGNTYTVEFFPNEPTPTFYLLRLLEPAEISTNNITPEFYSEQRSEVKNYWDGQLSNGTVFEVPEEYAMSAMKNTLIQNLYHGWRYSVGNAYESWFSIEGSDAAKTMGHFGYESQYRALMSYLLECPPKAYPSWEHGTYLMSAARYYYTTGDASYIIENKERFLRFMQGLREESLNDPNGLLTKQNCCDDIPEPGYYWHHHATAWRGIRDMALIFKEIGDVENGEIFSSHANHFRNNLLAAVKASQKTLTDGSLYIPISLIATTPEIPNENITETRLGAYWNLVAPYGITTWILPPDSDEIKRLYNYCLRHGSFLAGMVRFNYYPVRHGEVRLNGLSGYKTDGVDNIYGPHYLQFVASQDDADRIVLMFYAKLVHGMTRNTFVCGEGDTVGPFPGEYYRTMYLPPSSFGNAYYLDLLRTMLLHETVDDNGYPDRLLIAGAVPRDWLASGKRIRVENAPTLFGPISFTIESNLESDQISVELKIPEYRTPTAFSIRLRTPEHRQLIGVTINGVAHDRFLPDDESVDLTGFSGKITMEIRYAPQ